MWLLAVEADKIARSPGLAIVYAAFHSRLIAGRREKKNRLDRSKRFDAEKGKLGFKDLEDDLCKTQRSKKRPGWRVLHALVMVTPPAKAPGIKTTERLVAARLSFKFSRMSDVTMTIHTLHGHTERCQ